MSRPCTKCGAEFDIKGTRTICLPCARIQNAAYRARCRAAGIKRKPANLDPARHAAWKAEYWKRPETRARIAANSKKRQMDPKHQQRLWARRTVRNEVQAGRVEKLPCRDCGDHKSQAHHHDYSKPLDVVWLCQRCHTAEHKRMRVA